MGPLTHRETRLDAFLNAQKDVKWSEEAENEYLENVKTRATEKVRALLLQAKRRSDEIIHEAELKAQEITAKAEQNGKIKEQKAQETLKQAEQRYENAYREAVQKAQTESQQILIQNQQALGESTAIVLLSIHEQLTKFYEVWKEDLKQLTIDAIEVGTGWIATAEKEAILKQLLDESVQKLLDKKNFIVRVNPADAELITQVLENSGEKSWTMESSKDLEPGSLELESDNVYVKNSHSERQKFVQEILDNLTLPGTADEQLLTQKVKDTLDHEMQHNPVLAHAVDQNSQEPLAETPSEKVMPEPIPDIMQSHGQQIMQEQTPETAEQISGPMPAADFAQDFNPVQEAFAEPMPEPEQADEFSAEQNAGLQEKIHAAAQSAEQSTFDSGDMFEALQQQMQNTAPQTDRQPQNANMTEETESAEIIEELPTFGTDAAAQTEAQAHAEAQDMVEEFLGTPKKDDTALPNDIADDLLAEMGFNQK